MAEMMAMMSAAAPSAAGAAGTAAAGTTGLLGTAGAAAPSAMAQSLLAPQAATPFFTEAAMSSAIGSDPTALARALSPETFAFGAPPSAGTGMNWQAMAKQGLDMMDESQKPLAGLGQRPQGYQPTKSMQEQFAEIMGWLEQQGGRR
jgi:hypothetical protein